MFLGFMHPSIWKKRKNLAVLEMLENCSQQSLFSNLHFSFWQALALDQHHQMGYFWLGRFLWLCEIIPLGSVSNSDDNAKNGTYHSLSLYVVNLKPQLHGTETVTAPWFAADRIQASRGVQGRSGMAVESGLELWLQVFPLAKEHQRPQEKQQRHGASMYFLHVSVQQSRCS